MDGWPSASGAGDTFTSAASGECSPVSTRSTTRSSRIGPWAELEHVADLDGRRDVGNPEVVARAAVDASWYSDVVHRGDRDTRRRSGASGLSGHVSSSIGSSFAWRRATASGSFGAFPYGSTSPSMWSALAGDVVGDPSRHHRHIGQVGKYLPAARGDCDAESSVKRRYDRPAADQQRERGREMKRMPLHRPSAALVVGCLALGIALTGTSYATGLGVPNGSVTTAKIKDGAVTTPKLKNAAVTTPKLKNDAVTSTSSPRTPWERAT